MAELDTKDLQDAAFAYVEPGGMRDPSGRTTPRDKRHLPMHTADAVRLSLSQAPNNPFGKLAMPALVSAARKFGVNVTGAQRAFGGMEPDGASFPERRFTRFPLEVRAERARPAHLGVRGVFRQAVPEAGRVRRAGQPERVQRVQAGRVAGRGVPVQPLRRRAARHDPGPDPDAGDRRDGAGVRRGTPVARADVLEYVQRGDICHSSFAFRVFPGGDEWGVSEYNYPMRTLHAVQLIDVAPVLNPAYPDATAAARAVDGAVRSLVLMGAGRTG